MSPRSKAQQRKKSAVSAGGIRSAVYKPKLWTWQVAGICVLLAALVFAVFGQTLNHDFVNFDDDQYVYKNPLVSKGLTVQGVAWAFTHSHAANWHPLTTISHMLDCQFYGLAWPGGHHLTNVLLHTAGAVLLFLIFMQMTGTLWRCALVASLFAIHPLRVESVAWVAERKDVLSGVFFMLTLLAYARYARRPESKGRYAMVALWFALGLMSKPMLVTVPFVLLLLDYWPLGRLQRGSQFPRLMMEKLPLLALSAISCVVTIYAQKEAIQPMEHYPLSQRIGNALVAYCVYLGKTFYPAGLALPYPILKNGWPAWQVAAAAMLLVALTAGAWMLRRKQPYLIVGWLWYLWMLVPVIGILQVGGQTYADRYTYLPQIGLCFAAVWAVADLTLERSRLRVAAGSAAAAVLCILAAAAWRQASWWRDSQTLWQHSLAITDGNYIARNNLGCVFFEKGSTGDAITQFHEALQINPDYVEARNNLAGALFQLGNTLLQQDQTDEAAARYSEALQFNPSDAQAHDNLGGILFQEGHVDDAITQYHEAVRINPADAGAHFNLGNALFGQGKADEAIAQAQQALDAQPGNTMIENTLAWMLVTAPRASQRNGVRAVQLATQAAQSTGGNDPDILRTQAAAYAEAGKFPDAVQTAQKALQLAQNRSNATLAGALRRDLALYEAGRRIHDAP